MLFKENNSLLLLCFLYLFDLILTLDNKDLLAVKTCKLLHRICLWFYISQLLSDPKQ